jgi:hypothetical protein
MAGGMTLWNEIRAITCVNPFQLHVFDTENTFLPYPPGKIKLPLVKTHEYLQFFRNWAINAEKCFEVG